MFFVSAHDGYRSISWKYISCSNCFIWGRHLFILVVDEYGNCLFVGFHLHRLLLLVDLRSFILKNSKSLRMIGCLYQVSILFLSRLGPIIILGDGGGDEDD